MQPSIGERLGVRVRSGSGRRMGFGMGKHYMESVIVSSRSVPTLVAPPSRLAENEAEMLRVNSGTPGIYDRVL